MFHLSARESSSLSSLSARLLFSRILLPRHSGETYKSVSTHVTPGAFTHLTTQTLSSQTQHQFSCYRKARQISFFYPILPFFFVNSVSIDWFAMRWESHCPCLKVNTPPGWCQLSSPGQSVATYLSCLLPNDVACDGCAHSTCTVCMLVRDDGVEAIGAIVTQAVRTVCLPCLTSVVEPCWWNTQERRLALAWLHSYQAKHLQAEEGLQTTLALQMQLNLTFARTDILPESKTYIIGWK